MRGCSGGTRRRQLRRTRRYHRSENSSTHDRRGLGAGRRQRHRRQSQMLQDARDDRGLLDAPDDAHGPLAGAHTITSTAKTHCSAARPIAGSWRRKTESLCCPLTLSMQGKGVRDRTFRFVLRGLRAQAPSWSPSPWYDSTVFLCAWRASRRRERSPRAAPTASRKERPAMRPTVAARRTP